MTDGIEKLEAFTQGRIVMEHCLGEPLPDANVVLGLRHPIRLLFENGVMFLHSWGLVQVFRLNLIS